MVVGFTTTCAINAYHHSCCEFESRSGRGVQHYVIKFVSDLRQVVAFLRVVRLASRIKLTATITKILLKMVLNTIKQTTTINIRWAWFVVLTVFVYWLYLIQLSIHFGLVLWLWCWTLLSTIFQLYRGGQFYCWSTRRKPLTWQTWSHNIVSSTPHPSEIRSHNVSGDRSRLHSFWKSNYHTITTTTVTLNSFG